MPGVADDTPDAQGLIGIIMATSPEFVAPFGAKQPILGTNPIACGVPTDQGLMLMDQATAAFPWFGLLEAKTAGIEIPEGVAYDQDGHPTRDPNALSPAVAALVGYQRRRYGQIPLDW